MSKNPSPLQTIKCPLDNKIFRYPLGISEVGKNFVLIDLIENEEELERKHRDELEMKIKKSVQLEPELEEVKMPCSSVLQSKDVSHCHLQQLMVPSQLESCCGGGTPKSNRSTCKVNVAALEREIMEGLTHIEMAIMKIRFARESVVMKTDMQLKSLKFQIAQNKIQGEHDRLAFNQELMETLELHKKLITTGIYDYSMRELYKKKTILELNRDKLRGHYMTHAITEQPPIWLEGC